MATQHDHCSNELSNEELIAAAREALEGAGGQWTEMRHTVFEELLRNSRPASAYAVADDVSKRLDKRVAANSIYRILDLFVEHGIAMRIESANAYLASLHPGEANDCIFLVCDQCGEASHIDDIGVSKAMRALADKQSFQATRPVLEMRGLCNACS